MQKFHIKKGDNVVVISGNNKGAKGKILKIFRDSKRIIVEKVNLRKKTQRPSRDNPQGGIVEKELPIAISNVKLICNKCGHPTRVGYKKTEDGRKVRYCKKCREIID